MYHFYGTGALIRIQFALGCSENAARFLNRFRRALLIGSVPTVMRYSLLHTCFFLIVDLYPYLPHASLAQSDLSLCEPVVNTKGEDCSSISETSNSNPLDFRGADNAVNFGYQPSAPRFDSTTAFSGTVSEQEKEGFHWGRALKESATLLVIEQSYVVHTDFRWVVSENGIPFNHYWRDYMQSLHSWKDSGWSDGDPNMFGYVGHPVQGAFTSYIWIQNDPKAERMEFSNTKAYWRSRLEATIWNAVYSTQWNLGPISEVTVEKYGTQTRQPWNRNGTWPCTSKNCFTGVGQIDIVMTPIGGFGWLIGEEWMDKNIMRRVEASTRNRFLIDAVRCTFNPIRAGANILHGNRPWFRPRDNGDWHLAAQN
jgi:hypothetical protein